MAAGIDYSRYARAARADSERRSARRGTAVTAIAVPAGRMSLVPSAPVPAVISRRGLLMSAATLAVVGVSVAACGSAPPPPEVDELTAQLDRARADSRLATDAAATARQPMKQTLTTIAAERDAHAQALADELVRLVGTEAPTATAPTSTAAPATPATVREVIGALRQSAESATGLAAQMSGYRAGLLGSIAASCTAAWRVALAPPAKDTP
ncbi:Tat pathway signal protein [Mycolicibacterium monacense DSM 44395]|nr:Tat pathway signal protein [Mycolicibacterium monacense DSM 44395]